MSYILLFIFLGILILDYIVERILDHLNMSRWSDRLPEELKGIYDEEHYTKSQQYLKAKQRLSFLTSTVTFFMMLLVLASGGFAWLDQLVRIITVHPILMALIFFGILGGASSILAIPFEYYAVFVIEERFGFNTMTLRTFILDKLKGWLLGAILGGGLLALVVWIYGAAGNYFWLIAWGVVAFIMIFMTMFYSNLIVPLFNKQRPLEPGELRDAIESFASRTGFRLKNIYVIDGSKRSKKANAYFTGLGAKKRIVLYDTLINDHTTDELVAVLAHEIGHYKKRHTLQGIAISLLQTGLMLFILSLFIRKDSQLASDLCQALGGIGMIGTIPGFHLGVLAFGILYSPLSSIIGLAENYLSRHNEYAADRFAAENYRAESLRSALIKLSVNNLSNLRPHPAYVFVYYSHPTLLQRLNELMNS